MRAPRENVVVAAELRSLFFIAPALCPRPPREEIVAISAAAP